MLVVNGKFKFIEPTRISHHDESTPMPHVGGPVSTFNLSTTHQQETIKNSIELPYIMNDGKLAAEYYHRICY